MLGYLLRDYPIARAAASRDEQRWLACHIRGTQVNSHKRMDSVTVTMGQKPNPLERVSKIEVPAL